MRRDRAHFVHIGWNENRPTPWDSSLVGSTRTPSAWFWPCATPRPPEQLTGEAPLPDPLPLGKQLELRYLQEIRWLPSDTQTLLLTAAADPTGDPGLLWRVGKDLGYDAAVGTAAEAHRLATIGTSVRFRHPLVRSAAYYGRRFPNASVSMRHSPARPV